MIQKLSLSKLFFLTITCCLGIGIGGCSFLKFGERYENSGSTGRLEAPPDLVTPDWENSLEIPKTANDRVSALDTQGLALNAAVLPEFVKARVRKEGPTRWLEVDADPVTLWPIIENFWQQAGFELEQNEPKLGFMETAWKQNTRKTETEATNAESYDITGEKFRIRLEREPNAVTNIFVTHRGAEIGAVNRANQILWKPQNPNPERESEMTMRLLDHIGGSQINAGKEYAEAPEAQLYIDLQNVAGVPVLLVGDNFSRVWRRTGVALDRAGLAIADQNRAQGIYHVAFEATPIVQPASTQEAPSVKHYYDVHLLAQGQQTLITTHLPNGNEGKIDPETSRQILKRVLFAYPGVKPNS